MIQLKEEIPNWLTSYIEKSKLNSFVIGISGGIDSAVTSTLCAMTGKKTILLIMPIHQNQDETNRGIDHCNWLISKYSNVQILNYDLTSIYESYKNVIPNDYHNKLSLANTRARIRMTTLYLIAGNVNGLVVGTGNKVEDFGVGFFTKYGDGGVDISPIADLMKSEVYELAKDLNIIKSIVEAKPTDGLWDDGRTDEDQLGVSYDDLEWAMQYNGEEISDKQKEILEIYKKHRSINIHKMKNIPIFKKNDCQ